MCTFAVIVSTVPVQSHMSEGDASVAQSIMLAQQRLFTGYVMKCRWREGYSGGRRQPRSVLLPKRYCPGHSYVPKAQERSAPLILEVSCSCLANVNVQHLFATSTFSLQHMLEKVCYWVHAFMPLHLSAAQFDLDQILKEKRPSM